MNINKSTNFLRFESESLTSIKRFCLEALRDPNLIVSDISTIKRIERVPLFTLQEILERSFRINQIDYIVIHREATKYKALIGILNWLHSLSIKVRFTPQLSEEQALKLPLTLLRSMIL